MDNEIRAVEALTFIW